MLLLLLLTLLLNLKRRRLLPASEGFEDAYRVLGLLRPAPVEEDGDQLVPAPAGKHGAARQSVARDVGGCERTYRGVDTVFVYPCTVDGAVLSLIHI